MSYRKNDYQFVDDENDEYYQNYLKQIKEKSKKRIEEKEYNKIKYMKRNVDLVRDYINDGCLDCKLKKFTDGEISIVYCEKCKLRNYYRGLYYSVNVLNHD
jgi:hypothetical protein